MKKGYLEMTEAERDKAAKLTPKESAAVYEFIRAARCLPRSICIEVQDGWDESYTLKVSKRISHGACRTVAKLKKKSLCF